MRPFPNLLAELEALNADLAPPSEARLTRLGDLGWELVEAQPELAYRVAQQLTDLLKTPGLSEEAVRKARADVLIITAGCDWINGRYIPAISRAAEALSILHDLPAAPGLDASLARVYYNLGYAYQRLGDYTAAQEAHAEQLEMAERTGDPVAIAAAYRNLGALYFRLGEHEIAFDYFRQCEGLLGADHLFMAGVYINITLVYIARGEYEQALAYGLRSLPLFEASGYMMGVSRIHANLGRVYGALGRFDEAEYHLERAVALSTMVENPYSQLLAYTARGEVRQHEGQLDDALAAHHQALAIALQIGDRFQQTNALRRIATVHEARGQIAEALAACRQYIAIRDTMLRDEQLARLRSLETLRRTREAQAEAETQRRLREQERRQAARVLAMRDEFLDAATHDLKNPLSVIAMSVHKLRHYVPPDNAPAHETFDRIEATIRQMRELIANLLDLTPLETGYILQLTPVDLVALTRDVMAQFAELAEHKNISLRLHTTLPALTMPLDNARIRQALSNLLSNAVKYTPSGGSISLTLIRMDGSLYLHISDTGIGIPPDALPHIFDRFYRVRSPDHERIEGSGLGLAIVRSIIEQHGGIITVSSISGAGTTFSIILPVTEA